MKIYGIKNCNTVKKALDWLKAHNVDFEFHDFKKSGISQEKLLEWTSHTNWEALINKKGTTWKQLDEGTKNAVNSQSEAFKIMKEKTSVIKRPVLETDKGVIFGFDEHNYKNLLGIS